MNRNTELHWNKDGKSHNNMCRYLAVLHYSIWWKVNRNTESHRNKTVSQITNMQISGSASVFYLLKVNRTEIKMVSHTTMCRYMAVLSYSLLWKVNRNTESLRTKKDSKKSHDKHVQISDNSSLFYLVKPGCVVQLVGHLTCKSEVLGSIPGLATYFHFSFRWFRRGDCQLPAKVCAWSTG